MSCNELRDAILDAARGVADAGAEARVRAHVEACGECARKLEEQRRLTGGMRALARADLASAEADIARLEAMEGKLLSAFDERRASFDRLPAVGAGAAGPSVTARARRYWMPLSAAAALFVAAFVGWSVFSPGDGATSGSAAPASPGPAQANAGAGEQGATTPGRPPQAPPATGGAELVARAGAAARVNAGTDRRAGSAGQSVSGRVTGQHAGRAAASPDSRVPPGNPATQPALIVAEGFTPLPLAESLPAFESGEIVRTSVAPAALPAFGLDIPMDAGSDPVPVDFLVGQDGHARAIRLVTQAVDGTRLR